MDEDLGAVVVDLHNGVVAHFEEILAGADLAQPLVDDGEADDFVEVEAVAVEGRELAQGEVEFHLGELAALVGADAVELDDELVVAAVGDVLHGVRDLLAVEVKEEGVELGVPLRVVGIKKGTQLAFQSERSGQCA